jgi:hypothetical protein
MKVGLIVKTSDQGKHALVSDGHETHQIAYVSGRSIIYGKDLPTPILSENHEQHSPKARLKLPRIGDAVVFENSENSSIRWGYLDSYLSAVHRQWGSEFRPNPKAAA